MVNLSNLSPEMMGAMEIENELFKHAYLQGPPPATFTALSRSSPSTTQEAVLRWMTDTLFVAGGPVKEKKLSSL